MSMFQDQKEKTIGIQELFALVKKYLALTIVAGLLGGMFTYAACSYLVAPVYEATAKMIVNARQEQTGTVTNDQILSAQKLVDTYAIIIRSQPVLEPVVEKLQLSMDFEQLARIVTVKSVNDTQVMEIAVQSTNAELAQSILAEIVATCPAIIIDAVDAGSVKTIEPAHLRKNPVAPNTNVYTLLAGFLCMFAVVAIVIVRHMMDNTYKSESDLKEDLGLPVLGIIPDYEGTMKRASGKEGYRYG